MSEHASKRIKAQCESIAEFLIDKNNKYGDSALEPLNIFSKATPIEGLLQRIDDKLKRMKNYDEATEDEDVIRDLIGYLILLELAIQDEQPNRNHLPFHSPSAGAHVYPPGNSTSTYQGGEAHNED
tara:strand:+ start:69 stop:446 length:378 start_codon:yes stop_codon:yes gene_type:complete